MRRLFTIAFTAALTAALLVPSVAFASARIIIQNNDPAGKGFNETTAAQPVGGNTGTTLGEQRLNAFRFAADIWQGQINSNVDIVINAAFAPIVRADSPCTASTGILGSAGPVEVFANFDNAPQGETWYPAALANALAGRDLSPSRGDINATFNSLVDTPECLQSSNWYYGLDGRHGGDIDLVVVLLHEFAHGLGMSGTTSLSTGRQLQNRPSVFETRTVDLTTGLRWNQMTEDQRRESVTHTGNVVWDGPSTRIGAEQTLAKLTTLTVTEPSLIARNFDIGLASFGPAASQTAVSGKIVAAADAADPAGPSATDGCSAYTNASDMSGNISLVDRGTCSFFIKAQQAQAAGARAVVIADNRREDCLPPALGIGTADDGSTIRIPVISLRQDDGAAIRASLGSTVSGMLRIDPSAFAGASSLGTRLRLYAPCTFESGSSIHHWDVSAAPNLLMEPRINDDLPHGVDVTINQLIDIGWTRSASNAVPGGRRILKRGK